MGKLWSAIALFAVACGGGGGGEAKKPIGPAIDEKTAQKDARGLTQEILQTLGRGNKDGLFALLDDSVIVFGPRRADAATNRTEALMALGQVIDPKTKKKLALRSSSAMSLVASQGGRSAWAFNVVDIDRAPHAITAILVSSNGLWQVGAALVAKTPAKAAIKTELAKNAVVPPGGGTKEKIGAGARGAVERFQKGLVDQASWGADLSSHTDAIVIGPGAGEVTRGNKDITKLWKKRVDVNTRAVAGDITAAVTADGQLAWVTAPITRASDKEEPTPLRAFAVFEKTGTDWKLILLHESLAFDQPGSGASFKKAVPPVTKREPDKKEEPKKDKKPEKTKK